MGYTKLSNLSFIKFNNLSFIKFSNLSGEMLVMSDEREHEARCLVGPVPLRYAEFRPTAAGAKTHQSPPLWGLQFNRSGHMHLLNLDVCSALNYTSEAYFVRPGGTQEMTWMNTLIFICTLNHTQCTDARKHTRAHIRAELPSRRIRLPNTLPTTCLVKLIVRKKACAERGHKR